MKKKQLKKDKAKEIILQEKHDLECEHGDETEECICIRYNGDSWGCKMHEPKNECPRCHCIEAERLISEVPSIKNFGCNICGEFYARNTVTGEYTF